MVFITRGPMYLVAVASTGEPVAVLAAQLDLIHKQLIAILTDAVERAFFKSPRFDMRQLLGGTAPVLQVRCALDLFPTLLYSTLLYSTLLYSTLTLTPALFPGAHPHAPATCR
jgi:hypothetical protein